MPCRLFRSCPQTLPISTVKPRASPIGCSRLKAGSITLWGCLGQAAQLASNLTQQFAVQKGQRVAIAMQNSTGWIIAFLAVTSLGAVAVLVNSRGAPSELDRAICDTGCSLVIADSKRAERLQEAGGQASTWQEWY